jgi:sterol 3beta-glucosyltransferase
MRILLTNAGTLGDIQPLIALGVELRRHGHAVILASSAGFADVAARWGLEFRCVAPELRDVIRRINIAIITTPGLSYSTSGLQALGAPLAAALPEMYERLLDASKDVDVLVAGQMQPAARMVHERTGVPFVSVQITALGSKGTPAWRRATEALVNPVRARAGLPPLADPMTTGIDSPQLALYAISRVVRPPQRVWPPHVHTTGYFFLDEPDWHAPAELEEFLAAGDPPIAITFGSNMIDDSDRIGRVVTDALRRENVRAIVQQGWSNLTVDDAGNRTGNGASNRTGAGSDNRNAAGDGNCDGDRNGIGDSDRTGVGTGNSDRIFAADYVPHHWLFPRCRAIVHHGGAGTTAAALRAGRPAIVVPHAFDQIGWAEVTHQLGCSPPPLRYADITSDRLAAALAAVHANRSYAQRGEALAMDIRAEQGVERARTLIESLVERLRAA